MQKPSIHYMLSLLLASFLTKAMGVRDTSDQVFFVCLFFRNTSFFFLFLKNKFVYLFLAALGLRFCAWAFSSCVERGLFFVAVHGLLIAVASLVAEHGL